MDLQKTLDCWEKECVTCDCDGLWLHDPSCWELMQATYIQPLFNYFNNRFENRDLAQRLAARTFSEFFWYVYHDKFDHTKKVRPLLFTFAHNIYFDELLSLGRDRTRPLDEKRTIKLSIEESQPFEGTLDDIIELYEVLKYMADEALLSPYQHKVLEFRFVDGLSVELAAAILGRSVTAIYKATYAARAKLKIKFPLDIYGNPR